MKNNQLKRFIITLLTLLTALIMNAQNVTVSGKVTDDNNGEELIGVAVSVIINEQTTGTITDLEGNYTISCNEGDILTFSSLGYEKQKFRVGKNPIINVALIGNAENLDELIVVGYGQQKKESVIGAISSIDNKALVGSAATNVSQSMAGLISGVQVVQPSGEVGNDDAEIYVRGTPTFNDNSPLIIVDGIMRESFSQIDPNEIQSLNVLKDASATAVYGIKGANGVIIVTTKRGRLSKPKVNFSFKTGIAQPTRIPQPIDAYRATMIQNMREITGGTYSSPTNSSHDLMLYRTGASPYTHSDYAWTDVIMKDHSNTVNANINVSGGTETIKYFISAGAFSQNSIYKYDPYTKFTRYNFRSNFDIDITKDFKIAINVGTRIEDRTFPSTVWNNSWNIYRGAFALSGREAPYLNPDGSLGGTASVRSNQIGKIRDSGHYEKVKSVLETSLVLTHKLDFITKGLEVKGQIAFDDQATNETRYVSSYQVFEYDVQNNDYTGYNELNPLRYAWGNVYDTRKLYGEISLMYNRTFNKHTVHGMVLGNRDLKRIGATNAGNQEMPFATQGFAARSTYNYDSRYFFEANIGYNGSENFAPENRYGFFPSGAIGWMLTNESFFKESSLSNFLTSFKIKATYGVVGNDKVPGERFMYLAAYENSGGALFGTGNDWHSGIRQLSIENRAAQWEMGYKSNIGVESNFFNGLLVFNFDYFYEHRNEILLIPENTIPYYVGADFAAANYGIVDNEGFEFELKHSNTVSDDFRYNINGNFSYAHSTIIQKDDPALALAYQKEAGFSVNMLKGYEVIGVFEDYQDIENSPAQIAALGGLEGNNHVYPGDLKYKDVNGDGIINEDDATMLKYPSVPEIGYGISMGASYKGFDLSLLIQGAARASFPKNWEIQNPFSNTQNALAHHWNYWTPLTAGDAEYINRFFMDWKNNEPSGGRSTFSVGSGSYVRLKSAQIGYTLPDRMAQRIKVSNVRFFVTGLNLFILSEEPYLDPDNRQYRGGNMPPTRNFDCGVNIKF